MLVNEGAVKWTCCQIIWKNHSNGYLQNERACKEEYLS